MNSKIGRDEVLDFIAETIINTLGYPKDKAEITYNANMIWDIGLNSIDFMRLINALEEKFNICYRLDNIVLDETVEKVIENVMNSSVE